jgi:mersacidin/lichenicidin family type 2 lantibiotic
MVDIIRAWKDEAYWLSLTEDERKALPENPAGILELSDIDLMSVSGGSGDPYHTKDCATTERGCTNQHGCTNGFACSSASGCTSQSCLANTGSVCVENPYDPGKVILPIKVIGPNAQP